VPIDLELRDGIAIVTINQPDKLNALNSERLQALTERIDEVAANPRLRVIVLTGAGDRAFVAGADIKEMASLAPEQATAFGRLGRMRPNR
jgi:enoyl-CoA hydratase